MVVLCIQNSFNATEVQHWRQDKTRQNIDHKLQLIYHTMSVHDIILNARLLNNIIRETIQYIIQLKEQYNNTRKFTISLFHWRWYYIQSAEFSVVSTYQQDSALYFATS